MDVVATQAPFVQEAAGRGPSPAEEKEAMAEYLLIDSNMIENPELGYFLARRPDNFAILAIEVWFEMYKQRSVGALRRGLEIVARYPDQILGIRPTGEILRLDPVAPGLVDRMIDRSAGRAIEEMLLALGNGEDLADTERQLRSKWDRAVLDNDGMLDGAADVLASLPEMQCQLFSMAEVGIIRRNEQYTFEMFGTVFGAAEQLCEAFCEALGMAHVDHGPAKTATLQFRIALGIVIYLLWWISKGSQSRKKLEATRNDILDLFLAAQATYFDGFFTCDAKASWIHANLEKAIEAYNRARPA